MAFHLRNSRNSSPFCEFKFKQLKKLAVGYGAAAADFLMGVGGQDAESRERRVQGKQIDGSSLSMPFLLHSYTRSSLHSVDFQIPFVLPHSSSLCPVQKSLPLIRPPRLGLRSFCKDVGLMYSGFEVETDADIQPFIVSDDDVKSEVHQREVQRVCKIIDETFAIDRNMEAVLSECGVNLSHELVLSVLKRYKLARKPAFRFFSWAATIPGFDHNSETFMTMLSILGQARQFETMQSLLREMGDKGLLNIETFTVCIRVFAAAKERRKAVGIIDLMKKYDFKVDVHRINCLLHELCRRKLGKEAHLLFKKLEYKFTPNLRTYTILLNGWCRVKNLMEAGRNWNEMIGNGFKPDIIAYNTMIEGLFRVKKRSDAIKLFEVMKSKGPYPNVKSYTIVILDLCKQRDFMNEAVDYFDEMMSRGLKPDAAIYTCLMTGFINQNKLDAVYDILKAMDEQGCIPDGHTYNVLIKMMTNRRMPEDAFKIYKRMIRSGVEPSIHTYNMIMKAYFVAKNYEMGVVIWEEMKVKGFCADENSYTVLIGSLLRLGKWCKAFKYLEEMIDKGMRAPQLRGGELHSNDDTSELLLEKMKYDGNSEVAEVLSRWLKCRDGQ